MIAKLNPEMLLLARDVRGMTQKEIAERSSLTQGYLSLVEAGEKDASPEAIERLAAALQVPLGFLIQDERYTGFGISMMFYRKRSTALVSHLKRLQAEVNLRRIHVKTLLRGVDMSARLTTKKMCVCDHGSPENVAERLRAQWMIPIGPVRNLVATIESAGSIVFRFPFGTKDIDAISQWPEDTPPLFFVNAEISADRARFSLAHELGHVIMHDAVTEEIEDEANRFAAEFLMPARDIRSQLLGIDISKAAAMKPQWRVSMAALIRRARDLGRITDDTYRKLFIRLGQLGFRKEEPNRIAGEEPTVIPRILNVYFEQNVAVDTLAEILKWPADELLPRYLPAASMRIAQ